MNIKRFFAVFFINTLVLLCIAAVGGYFFVSGLSIGTGEQIEELDKVLEKHERKNLLVVGKDKSGVLADVIMVFSFSDNADPVNVISVQRDTEVSVGNGTWKINSVLQKGDETLVQAVKDVTGIPIHDYVAVNFKAVSDTVNLLGGVDFYVPQNMDYDDPAQDLHIHLREGQQHLDGDKALQLLRFRGYPMADIQRTKVQRDFIQAAFSQKAKPENISKVEGIFNTVSKNIYSSLTVSEVLNYVGMAKGNTIESYEIPITITGKGTVLVNSAEMKNLADAHFIEEESYLAKQAEKETQE